MAPRTHSAAVNTPASAANLTPSGKEIQVVLTSIPSCVTSASPDWLWLAVVKVSTANVNKTCSILLKEQHLEMHRLLFISSTPWWSVLISYD